MIFNKVELLEVKKEKKALTLQQVTTIRDEDHVFPTEWSPEP
jgi:hypothetical protein